MQEMKPLAQSDHNEQSPNKNPTESKDVLIRMYDSLGD